MVSWKWWVARLSALICLWKQCLLQQGPRPGPIQQQQAARVTSPSLTIIVIYPAHHLHPSAERPRAPHNVRPPAPGDRSSHGDQIGRSSESLICVAGDWACMQGDAHRIRSSSDKQRQGCHAILVLVMHITSLVRAKKREAMQTIGCYQENMHAHVIY